MTAKLELTIDNQAINQRLSALAKVLSNMQPVMLQIAEELRAQTLQTFGDEGYPSGSWTPLKRSTIRQREKKGHWPGKILQVSGQLAASIQPDAGADYAQVGTNLPYARIQHEGGTIHREGKVRLRTDAKGNLLRQKGYDKLAVFAKASHKRAVDRAVNYDIVLPSRRYFPVDADNNLIPRAYQAVLSILDRAFSG